MKVILYMATSINGCITKGDNDSDWVSDIDWKEFNKLKNDSGVMVMGSKTYEQFGNDFPQEGALNVVMTHDPSLLREDLKGALFTGKSPKEVLKMLEEKGFSQIMLIGGMKLNTSFLKDNLIDEIWVDIHPLLIGEGKAIFEQIKLFHDLKLLECKQLDGDQILLKYKI